MFLRKLENCEGVIFLTTNRVSNRKFLGKAMTSHGAAVMSPVEIARLAVSQGLKASETSILESNGASIVESLFR